MTGKPTSGISFRRAYLLSIALHVAFFALLVAAPEPYLGAAVDSAHAGPDESTRIAYLTIDHRAPPARAEHRLALTTRATAPLPTAKRATPKRQRRPTARPLPRPQDDPNAVVAKTRQPQIGRIVVALATPPPERTEQTQPHDVSADLPAPSDAPIAATAQPQKASVTEGATPQAVVQAAARGIDVPPGGWGQSFEKPIVADDDALSAIRARYHAGAPIEIQVDESGRATRIVMPAGLADDVRAELEKRLLALRYVPAECNGLRCTGTLQLVL